MKKSKNFIRNSIRILDYRKPHHRWAGVAVERESHHEMVQNNKHIFYRHHHRLRRRYRINKHHHRLHSKCQRVEVAKVLRTPQINPPQHGHKVQPSFHREMERVSFDKSKSNSQKKNPFFSSEQKQNQTHFLLCTVFFSSSLSKFNHIFLFNSKFLRLNRPKLQTFAQWLLFFHSVSHFSIYFRCLLWAQSYFFPAFLLQTYHAMRFHSILFCSICCSSVYLYNRNARRRIECNK